MVPNGAATSADDAGRHHPVGDRHHRRTTAQQMNDVEDHRRREQPKRKHDQHLMNRMSQQLGFAFHRESFFRVVELSAKCHSLDVPSFRRPVRRDDLVV
jgi:hypothetical protein